MYAREVIETIRKYIKEYDRAIKRDPEIPSYFSKFIESEKGLLVQLVRSNRFHFGDINEAGQMFKGGEMMFRDNSEFIKCPYPVLWFDARVPVFYKDSQIKRNGKIGCLINSLEDDLIHIVTFEKMPDQEWTAHWVKYFVAINKPISDVKNIDNHFLKINFPPDTKDKTMIMYSDIEIPEMPNIDPNMEMERSKDCLHLAWWGLLLLNCLNIEKEENKFSFKSNKKRKNKAKLPLLSYYTLKIKIPLKRKRNMGTETEGGGWTNRIHFCRGHFKKRKTGIYWWQPQVRGKNKKGMVLKDYEVNLRTDNPLPITHNSENPKDFQ